MSGTISGGKRCAKTNMEKYGKDYYQKIGRKGGLKGAKDGTIKGFALNPELARKAGTKGGKVSSRAGIKNGEGHSRPAYKKKPAKKSLLERIFGH